MNKKNQNTINILMLGWELPPHITGGLGTACQGLAEGLAKTENIKLTFFLPTQKSSEHINNAKIVYANEIPVFTHKHTIPEPLLFDKHICPYTTPNEFWSLRNKRYPHKTSFIKTNNDGKLNFSGNYQSNLFEETQKYTIAASQYANQLKFDIIHAHDWLTFRAGIAVKKTTQSKLVVHIHSTEFDRSGGKINPSIFAIEKEGMENADSIITVSERTKNIVIEKYGIKPAKIDVLYNGIKHLQKGKRKTTKRRDYKLITFLGRITIQKGPEYFIRTAKQLLEKTTNVKFIMAGSGDLLQRMIDLTIELNISEYFHFTGFVNHSNVFELLNKSDVFVMPSVSEPFGITALEAIQCQTPIIISRQSGVSEVIENAIKVDYNDTGSMAEGIYSLLQHPEYSKKLVKNAKTDIEQLKWEKISQKQQNIYMQTLAKS